MIHLKFSKNKKILENENQWRKGGIDPAVRCRDHKLSENPQHKSS